MNDIPATQNYHEVDCDATTVKISINGKSKWPRIKQFTQAVVTEEITEHGTPHKTLPWLRFLDSTRKYILLFLAACCCFLGGMLFNGSLETLKRISKNPLKSTNTEYKGSKPIKQNTEAELENLKGSAVGKSD